MNNGYTRSPLTIEAYASDLHKMLLALNDSREVPLELTGLKCLTQNLQGGVYDVVFGLGDNVIGVSESLRELELLRDRSYPGVLRRHMEQRCHIILKELARVL